MARALAAEAVEQERVEAWIMAEVGRGAALPGLYPMDAATRARYEAERARPAAATRSEGESDGATGRRPP